MSWAAWRIPALIVILAAIAYVCAQDRFGELATYGGVGASAFTSADFRLGTVAPGTSLARAGLHTGDVVHWANWNIETRSAVAAPMPGSRATLVTSTGRHVTLVALPEPLEGLPPLFVALRLAFLIVAGFLVARSWESRAVRSLVVFLFGFGLALGLSSSAPIVSSYLSFALFMFGNIALLIIAVAAAADFSAHVTGDPRRVERLLSRLTVAVALAAVLILGYAALLVPTSLAAIVRGPLALLGTAPFLLAIATVIAGYVEARGSDRIRKRWVLWVIGLGLAGPAIDLFIEAFIGYNYITDQSALVTIAIIPFGLAYVILRHRLIDVGFVLNQAAVFAAVSVIVVGIIVLVEYVLTRYLASISHATSSVVQVIVALALGFSINAIHKRVDRFVDRVFFRKRHEAEAALLAFAHDAAYVTDENVLLQRCVETIERHVLAPRACIWARDEASGAYVATAGTCCGTVDVNDPAVVAMRARHVVVDLHASGSAFAGALGFPMVSGGELLGALTCDTKQDQESYAPDEVDAIERVAEAVAHAMATLRSRALQREVERLRALERPNATEGALPAF